MRKTIHDKKGSFPVLLCLLLVVVVLVFLNFQGDISTGKIFPNNIDNSQSEYTEGLKNVVPIGRYAEDDSLSEETVYYTPDGDCYHKTIDCPSLNDSDFLYKAYKGDISDSRRACGICYK